MSELRHGGSCYRCGSMPEEGHGTSCPRRSGLFGQPSLEERRVDRMARMLYAREKGLKDVPSDWQSLHPDPDIARFQRLAEELHDYAVAGES